MSLLNVVLNPGHQQSSRPKKLIQANKASSREKIRHLPTDDVLRHDTHGRSDPLYQINQRMVGMMIDNKGVYEGGFP